MSKCPCRALHRSGKHIRTLLLKYYYYSHMIDGEMRTLRIKVTCPSFLSGFGAGAQRWLSYLIHLHIGSYQVQGQKPPVCSICPGNRLAVPAKGSSGRHSLTCWLLHTNTPAKLDCLDEKHGFPEPHSRSSKCSWVVLFFFFFFFPPSSRQSGKHQIMASSVWQTLWNHFWPKIHWEHMKTCYGRCGVGRSGGNESSLA